MYGALTSKQSNFFSFVFHKHSKEKNLRLNCVLDAMFLNFCKYLKELNEPAIDMMAREFMKTALPPMLTEGKFRTAEVYYFIF